jgi:hypothetical protein
MDQKQAGSISTIDLLLGIKKNSIARCSRGQIALILHYAF